MVKSIKAVALFSGGLDSSLAARLIVEQGIEVDAIYFKTPFSNIDDSTPQKATEALRIKLIKSSLKEDFLDILKTPKYGYGKNINPCIDCRILMLNKTRRIMEDIGAHFIITGEVLGQRPMTQNAKTLQDIEKDSCLSGLILRPLSAKLLPATIPEKKGWVDRERLYEIQGRSRKTQFKLAEKFGLNEYSSPAGGCLLTDPEFSKRVKDLLMYDKLSLDIVRLIRFGRYLRLSPDTRLIVGRNQKDNQQLIKLKSEGDVLLEPEFISGPTAILKGKKSEDLITLSAEIVARYSDHVNDTVLIKYSHIPNPIITKIKVRPKEDETINKFRL